MRTSLVIMIQCCGTPYVLRPTACWPPSTLELLKHAKLRLQYHQLMQTFYLVLHGHALHVAPNAGSFLRTQKLPLRLLNRHRACVSIQGSTSLLLRVSACCVAKQSRKNLRCSGDHVLFAVASKKLQVVGRGRQFLRVIARCLLRSCLLWQESLCQTQFLVPVRVLDRQAHVSSCQLPAVQNLTSLSSRRLWCRSLL